MRRGRHEGASLVASLGQIRTCYNCLAVASVLIVYYWDVRYPVGESVT